MDLRDTSAGASRAHTVAEGGHRGNCKRSLCHTVLEVPKPSEYSDKTSGNHSQYGVHTRNRGGTFTSSNELFRHGGQGPL